ncbi:hypothetical protein BDR06DRAFT_1002190 [Suillus hirtellus]|nr:hypothetical protein BDR06DRAFT_1002190 [Suillus hirtellus]
MPKAANDALNITLATLQLLIKHCIHLKQGDQEALKLSDEIARCVGGTFETLPNWNSVVNDDPCIKSHPCFPKTLDYHPLAAVGTLPILESQATRSLSIVRPFTVPTAVGPVMKQAPTVEVDSTPLSPLLTSLELEPLTPLAPSVASVAPSTTWHKLFVPGNILKKVKVIPHPRNDKKRKVEEDDTDLADAPRQNKLRKTRSGTTKAGLLTVAHTSQMYLVADIGQGIIVVSGVETRASQYRISGLYPYIPICYSSTPKDHSRARVHAPYPNSRALTRALPTHAPPHRSSRYRAPSLRVRAFSDLPLMRASCAPSPFVRAPSRVLSSRAY